MHLAPASLLFGLFATANAVPSLPSRSLSEPPPPRSSEFSLAVNLSGTVYPLTAVYIETRGVLLKIADTIDSPGTPAYVNSTDEDEDYFHDAVILDLTDDPDVSAPPGVYGLSTADPGGSHGMAAYVFATLDEQHFDFSVGNGHVGHEMTSGAQTWFACSNTVANVTGTFLSWGTYETNGSAPYGCRWTDVVQNFNLTRRANSIWW